MNQSMKKWIADGCPGMEGVDVLWQCGRYYKSGIDAFMEEQKAMPWQAVYDEFCVRNDVPVGQDFMLGIDKYVADVTSKR